MKERYHRLITKQALSPHFSPAALETIIDANLGQDVLRYQVGYDHYHYDNNSFSAGDAYMDELRRAVISALQRGDGLIARQSFGRLTHTAQDFYAHSNYVSLWRAGHPDAAPDEIHPQLAELLTDSHLHSGRLYFPLEAFAFIGLLKPFVLPLLPHDSHAWMNKDDPSRPEFEFAMAAAVKRTLAEFESICQSLSPEQISLFTV